MTADDTRIIASTWFGLYTQLKHTQWTDDDVINAPGDARLPRESLPAAEALKYVYDLAASDWRGAFELNQAPLAVLRAVHLHHGTTHPTPCQVKEMAHHFSAYHADPVEPFQKYLDDHHGEMSWGWLNDEGRRYIEMVVRQDSDIWIQDARMSGLFVFNKPGISINQVLDRALVLDGPSPAPIERTPE